jgi:hypothetical protein
VHPPERSGAPSAIRSRSPASDAGALVEHARRPRGRRSRRPPRRRSRCTAASRASASRRSPGASPRSRCAGRRGRPTSRTSAARSAPAVLRRTLHERRLVRELDVRLVHDQQRAGLEEAVHQAVGSTLPVGLFGEGMKTAFACSRIDERRPCRRPSRHRAAARRPPRAGEAWRRRRTCRRWARRMTIARLRRRRGGRGGRSVSSDPAPATTLRGDAGGCESASRSRLLSRVAVPLGAVGGAREPRAPSARGRRGFRCRRA